MTTLNNPWKWQQLTVHPLLKCHTLRAVWIRGVTKLNWTQNRIDVEPIGQVDTMEKIAQGRVWTGKDAASRDLLAAITGFSRAVATARHKAKIHQNRKWTEKDTTRIGSVGVAKR
uniref:Serine protease SPPA, chloroplastic-like n=1 Tax=Tanacetum cinerariifolium TaxID=118510 RepID=A0A699HBK9_TANCI|nr:serine protease SPPA, chloroplastic-like [Tanacetum cinerariifolium]